MRIVRLGAVEYLNARPLVYGLELRNDLFSLRFDVPSKCAALLHEGSIDLGMIPSIEYLRGPAYRIVPGIAIVSDGPVASVALFTDRSAEPRSDRLPPISARGRRTRSCACCAWSGSGSSPVFEPMPPDPAAMLRRCDAALLIGDPALFLDHEALGVQKIDLGEQWTSLTGLPFVWAFWAGRPGVAARVMPSTRWSTARDAGVAASDEVAAAYCGPERAARCQAYLRDNIQLPASASARTQGCGNTSSSRSATASWRPSAAPEFYR